MVSKYFKIHELVSKSVYEKMGEKAWRYVPDDLIMAIDTVKERFPNGTISINNYAWGGSRQWSGLRTADSSYYSATSMHSFMMAVDMIFSKYTADEVRKDILDNPSSYHTVRGLELDTSWVHIDIRNEPKLVTFTS